MLLMLPLFVMGQSAAMLSLAQGEINRRGLDETEVRARLLQEGIDIDNVAPTEYQSYRGRIVSILDAMQAEKRAENAAAASPAVLPAAITADEIPETTIQEAEAEAEIRVFQAENAEAHDSDIYGHALFTNQTLDVFRTTDGAQAPDSYVLGEGDEVHISIFGDSQKEIHQRIGADGAIQPEGANRIFLKGMTLAQARTAIRNNLSSHYSFRPDQIAVTITTARTLTVNIYGEVGTAGGFTISALNTAFNALSAAGGPTRIGSVRNIRLISGSSSTVIDLYDFMKNPKNRSHAALHNNDILFVPVAQKVVRIEGAVNRPMRYEMSGSEGLSELIDFAGGLRYDAYPEFVQVERTENGEKKYLEYNLSAVLSGRQKVGLENGDVVRVRESNVPMEKYVAVEGSVYYPGRYDLDESPTLGVLVEKAKPTYYTKTDYVFVERTRPDNTVEVLTVPFPSQGSAGEGFVLQERDRVRVLEQADYRDVEQIEVSGRVRRPFTRDFRLDDRMTVAQAIEYAGGLRESVYPVAYIFRRDLKNRDRMQYIKVDLGRDGEMLLQPGDRLNVYDNSLYTNVGEIRISGAVREPFGTAFDESMTVHDLIMMAGGFEISAAYNRVEVFRLNLSMTEQVELDMVTLAVDGDYNVISPEGFQLQPYDHVVVRRTPNFTTGRTVEVNGRVKYPGVYVLEDSKTQLSQVIEMAGGLLDDADPYARLFRTYRNRGSIGLNMKDVMSNKKSMRSNPLLMDGDVINIVRQENTVEIHETGTFMSQYTPDDYDPTGVSLIYNGKHNAAWYIRHYAGGFEKYADRNSVTVTLPNNQMEGTRRIMGIRKYPKVEPGSVITLRRDAEKLEKAAEPKEKKEINWGQVVSGTLGTLTSITSIIVLLNKM